MDKTLLEMLACPACRVGVKEQDGKILCLSCGRTYPVNEGVPVMLVDKAETVNGK